MVPPPVIAANRSHRTSLAGNNQLSQDAQAIAVMDAHYDQMWAQDVEAMYTYADASAAASRVTPFTSGPLAIEPARLGPEQCDGRPGSDIGRLTVDLDRAPGTAGACVVAVLGFRCRPRVGVIVAGQTQFAGAHR